MCLIQARTSRCLVNLAHVSLVELGMPPLAFAQLVDSGALGAAETRAFGRIMAREGVDLAAVIARQGQVPVRWFHEVSGDGRSAGVPVGCGVRRARPADLVRSPEFAAGQCGSRRRSCSTASVLAPISTALSTEFQHGVWTDDRSGRAHRQRRHRLFRRYLRWSGCPAVGGHARRCRPFRGASSDVPGRRLTRSSWVRSAIGSFSTRLRRSCTYRLLCSTTCRFSDPVAYRIGIAELRRVYEQRRPSSYTQLVRAQFDADPARADGTRIAAELDIGEHTQAAPARRGHHPALPAAAVCSRTSDSATAGSWHRCGRDSRRTGVLRSPPVSLMRLHGGPAPDSVPPRTGESAGSAGHLSRSVRAEEINEKGVHRGGVGVAREVREVDFHVNSPVAGRSRSRLHGPARPDAGCDRTPPSIHAVEGVLAGAGAPVGGT